MVNNNINYENFSLTLNLYLAVRSPEGANTGSRMQYSILRTAMLHSLHVEKCPLVSVYDITDLEEEHLATLLH